MTIKNPVMFIGQQILTATNGAPLSADANGQLISGLSFTGVGATGDTTTTSATDVLINSLTITPVAGDYLVFFGTSVDHSAQNVAVTLSIYSGGSLVVSSVRSPIPRFNGIGAVSLTPCVTIIDKVTVNGSQAIEARWKTASGTATAHQRTLGILRIV